MRFSLVFGRKTTETTAMMSYHSPTRQKHVPPHGLAAWLTKHEIQTAQHAGARSL